MRNTTFSIFENKGADQLGGHHAADQCITKTSLCNEDPLTPHFYIVKLGFTGVLFP